MSGNPIRGCYGQGCEGPYLEEQKQPQNNNGYNQPFSRLQGELQSPPIPIVPTKKTGIFSRFGNLFKKTESSQPQQTAQLPPQQQKSTNNPLYNAPDSSIIQNTPGNVVSPNGVKLELPANSSNPSPTQKSAEITENFIQITPDVFVKQVFEEVKKIISSSNSTNKKEIINIIDECITYINTNKIIFTESSSNLENSKLYYQLVQGFCYNVAYIFRDILDKKLGSDKLLLFQNQYNALCKTYNKIVENSAEVIRQLEDEIKRSNCQNKKLSEIQGVIAKNFNEIIAKKNAELADLQAKCPAGDCDLDDDSDDELDCEGECEGDKKPLQATPSSQAQTNVSQTSQNQTKQVAVAIVATEDKKKLENTNLNGSRTNAFNSKEIVKLKITISEKQSEITKNQAEIEKLKQQLTELQANTSKNAASKAKEEELTKQLEALEAAQKESKEALEKAKIESTQTQEKAERELAQTQEKAELALKEAKSKLNTQIQQAQAATNVQIEKIKAEKNAALKAAKVENNASLAEKNAALQAAKLENNAFLAEKNAALQAQKNSNASSQAKNAEIVRLNLEIQRLKDLNDEKKQAQLKANAEKKEAEAKAKEEEKQKILEKINSLETEFNILIASKNISQSKKTENEAKITELDTMFSTENSSKTTDELQKLYDEINKKYINLKEDLGGQVRTFIRSKGYGGGTKCGTDTAIKDGESPQVNINYYKLIEEQDAKSTQVATKPKQKYESTLQQEKTQTYGPYYNFFECVDTNEEVYNKVKDMIDQVYEGYHVAFFGYGYSGSGKSYTLLNNKTDDKGILILFINQALSSGATITVDKVFELYNEVNVDTSGIITLNPKTDKTDKTDKTLITTTTTPTITNITTENITNLLTSIEKSRKDANRISATMNNPESSRSHLFIKLKIVKEGKTGYLTICDMGGRENPIEILTNTTIDTEPKPTKPTTKPPILPEKLTIQDITGFSTTKSIFTSAATSTNIKKYNLYIETKLIETKPKETINTKISQIITLCKQGIYINESINHLIYYFQSKITKTPEILELPNKTATTATENTINIDFALTSGKECCVDTTKLDQTKLTTFKESVKNKFVYTTNIDYIDFLLKNTECYPIFTKPPTDLNATLTVTDDSIGMIRVLKEIENPANPSKFAVFACIREDYAEYTAKGGKRDTLIENNIKTLQFAESISSSG